MRGKEKCRALREIRQKIAEQNDIAYIVSECRHQGDCSGTCPKCESELRYLETQLKIRQNLGKAIAITGLAITMPALTACDYSLDFRNETEGSLPEESESPSGEYKSESGEPDAVPLPETSEATDFTRTEELAGDISDSSEPVNDEDLWKDIEGDISITFP